MSITHYDKSSLLEKLVASSPFLIYIYDLNEKKSVFSSRTMTEVLGYTHEEVQAMGTNIRETILHKEDFAKMEEAQNKVRLLKDGEELVTMSRYRKKQGDYGWFKNTRSVFLRNAAGEAQQELGIVQEITEEINIENKLLDSEIRFKAIFNSTSDFNFFVDSNFTIITLNYAAITYIEKYTGVRFLPGHNLQDAMSPEIFADAVEAMDKALKGQATDDIKDYVAFSGKKIWFRAKFFPVYDEVSKQVTGVNINLRDVTDAFESRIALEQHNAKLKEIARINSHEIRRPLSNMLGLTELLSHYKDVMPEDVKSLLDLLDESSQELDDVIKKIVRTAATES